MRHNARRLMRVNQALGPRSTLLLMRFDRQDGGSHQPTNTPPPPHADVPESMRPKEVSPSFTPFPLPKYDQALGYGPVRFSDIPDIEAAKQRQAARARTPNPLEMGFLELDEDDMTALSASSEQAAIATSESRAVDASHGSSDPLGGYHVAEKHFPIIDRLECRRPVADLLRQFRERPAREARTATVLDLASTLARQTDGEMELMLYELGQLFDPAGNGLNFIVGRVAKYGRPYTVTSELTKAYVHLVDALAEQLIEAQPARLWRSPSLAVQLVHFLALIKILEPNRWYAQNANAPQNRADYSHPSGINLRTAHHHTGESLVDVLHAVVAGDAAGETGETSAFLAQCTDTQIVDLLAGFTGLMPDGRPPGDVTAAVLRELTQRWAPSTTPGEVAAGAEPGLLERLYLVLRLADVSNDACLAPLLRTPCAGAASPACRDALDVTGRRPVAMTEAAMRAPRGPDFFAAMAREKRQPLQTQALQLLEESVEAAAAAQDDSLVDALLESGTELLLSARDKDAAVAVAKRLQCSTRLLSPVPHMATVAKRLAVESAPAAAAASTPLPHNNFVTLFEGKRVHPIRTFFKDLDFVRSVDNVFLMHASLVESSVHQLISAARRLRTGKDTLIVTTRCLSALATTARCGTTEKKRQLADQALEIISFEIEKGRVVLLTQEEEIALHDAGTYCNEDLMLWTVAAYLARHVPLVKVHTLMSTNATARRPHHFLKGEHSPLAARKDLYDINTPLLSALRSKELLSVTHHAPLERQVRDRRSSLFYVNPIRARFVYRRDKALFDKYHTTARNLAPGFSQGALASDLRGLGYYTPDHPQVPFEPLPAFVQKNLRR